ncbi:uncharacterized protein LAJ45_01954 [Morchella importuna]|uniref:uncharacterized protein n=1 Tax=Morchella importuna TaxID=1174673 RepID=UPI001E8E606D|nr:uncharacterized protein LAJ45_01954 [Morchella importuna]KAH8154186.1 hypothetical protein LAJ45_01954 [Morchella importuna]
MSDLPKPVHQRFRRPAPPYVVITLSSEINIYQSPLSKPLITITIVLVLNHTEIEILDLIDPSLRSPTIHRDATSQRYLHVQRE